MAHKHRRLNKKIIVCCDGTWQDGDSGYTKPSLIPYRAKGTIQVPSNVVRITRALSREDYHGKPQIIYYQTGVGTGLGIADKITGGLLGVGISNNIREAYSFITTNYVPGDEIILVGFSRGAFTVRSVAGLIRDIGLLTRTGMKSFYAIFKDNQNSRNTQYRDIFPGIPFSRKPKGRAGVPAYKRKLESRDLTRVYDLDGKKIRVQAIAVWDTVGSLGIPTIGWMQKVGVPQATKELKFFDTALSNTVRHAFQALALDEHRAPFSPAVWERHANSTTDLRQCWFPGAHSNVGGGYDDQECANISLAWMMDQLASIGLEFHDYAIEDIFYDNRRYYLSLPGGVDRSTAGSFKRPQRQWAVKHIYDRFEPVRPWGLGKIYEAETGVYHLTGFALRTPGRYKRADPETGNLTDEYMERTNERVHKSVRIRLDLEGLDTDDVGLYRCRSLLEQGWDLKQKKVQVVDSIPRDADWGCVAPVDNENCDGKRWVWEYIGAKDGVSMDRVMVEEQMGPFERELYLLSRGKRKVEKLMKKHRRKTSTHTAGYVVEESGSTQY